MTFLLEAGLTASLWDLFAGAGPVQTAMKALHHQLPNDDADPRVRKFRERVERHGSQAWLPRRAPGSDLALVAPDDEDGIADVLAFVEVKANAATNWPLRSTAFALPPLSGPVAAAISDEYFGDLPKAGVRMCQSDLYRSRKWWSEKDGIRLCDPDDVLWLLFDTRGRPPEEAFEGATHPGAWHTIDLKLFAAHLRELRPVMPLSAAHHDTIAVVLWHIDQAAGKKWEVTTTISPEPPRRPSVDEIGDKYSD
ncbi:hypothetical protein [Pseudarthrobacter sp. SSS035]|uniref:hypothetical protein n=1 Tax=Pseudarthrobacter sp. SSS035 TaxID=2931399 RepID=UPI00200D7D02|nr:hypothetical protein [Pseudarthrobacter sp. SSS035]